jgi:hypothetical protein
MVKRLAPILLTVVIPLSLFVGAKEALAASASLVLSPSSGTVGVNAVFDVGLYLNTNGAQIDGMDAKIIYEPGKLEAQSISPDLNVFADYPTQTINATSGRITLQGNAPSSSPYANNGLVQVATLRFKTLTEGTTSLRIDFTPGATTDSNVAEHGTNLDILSSVTNAAYTISPTASGTPIVPGSDLPEGATLTPTLLLVGAAAILLLAGVWRLRTPPLG